MAKKLFETQRSTSFPLSKPKYPKITPNQVPDFANLIGPNSWFLFHLLKLTTSQDWLKIPMQYWNEMTDYRKARDFFKTVEVTKDGAERGVKFFSDFPNQLSQSMKIKGS